MPVYNEGENVLTLYHRLVASNVSYDSLKFIYDFDTDSSLPFVAKIHAQDSRVVAEKKPTQEAKSVMPTLEDAYLYHVSKTNGINRYFDTLSALLTVSINCSE